MGCCRKIRHYNSTRSVLCLKWVVPVRICTLLTLVIHIAVFLSHRIEANVIATVVAAIHLTVVYLLLRECAVSVRYHKLLRPKH